MAAFATILSIATYAGFVYTIPPPQCFANFNWNDCGKSPQPVIYYWKTGSRCEVGIWRGCLPNINMFKDEYECVSTCIFTVRAAEQDWHKINAMEEDITANMTDYEDKGNGTDFGNSTGEYDNSTSVNSKETVANETATEGGDATDASTGDNAAGDTTIGDGTTVANEPGGGETVSAADGGETTVAEAEGEAEEEAEGEPEGEAEGEPVGEAEGEPEGEAEGEPEGEAEGKPEGEAEGEPEGKAEGEPEGEAEGEPEGEAEGGPEGEPEANK